MFSFERQTLGVDTKRPGSSYKEHEEPTEATGCLVLRGMSIFYHLLMFYLDFRNNGTNGTFPDVTSLLKLTSTLPPAHKSVRTVRIFVPRQQNDKKREISSIRQPSHARNFVTHFWQCSRITPSINPSPFR